MRIASWNVNGLRAAARHGFSAWFKAANLDILCLQEIKAGEKQLPPEIVNATGYQSFFNFASRPGYSGVAVFTKLKPLRVTREIFAGDRFNQEGRVLLLEFEQFTLLNLYIPHGGRDKSKLEYKLRSYASLLEFLRHYEGRPLVLVGDLNVAHHDIDLARPKQNRNNIMFTPEERQQLDGLFQQKLIDSYRLLHAEERSYTWWPYIANARQRNIGWRIDYIFVADLLQPFISEAAILKDVFGSDHCPVTINLELAEGPAAPSAITSHNPVTLDM